MRIAINGFGRIGRLVLRALLEKKAQKSNLEIIAINDPGGIETNAHLLKYDSLHGQIPHNIFVEDDQLHIDDIKIKVFSTRDVKELPWGDYDIDIVLDCTGKFTQKDLAIAHIEQGAKKVMISAPCKNADRTIVYGVNHHDLSDEDVILSSASCTTNCLAPVAYLLDEEIGIEKGFMTTIHAYTGDQPILDRNHKDLRRARAAAMSLVPTSTGAAKAVGLVLPKLAGKLDGTAVRVPTPNVSMVDLVFTAKRDTNSNEINAIMEKAASGKLKNVLGYNELPLVSTDFNHTSYSSIFDATQTQIVDGNLCRVLAWYDNEWGFSHRMLDICEYIAEEGLLAKCA